MKTGILGLLAAGAMAMGGCVVNDDGNFSLTWSIVVDGRAGTCNEVGAATVEVISTRAGSGMGVTDQFRCSDFAGTTDPLPSDDYTVVVQLLDNAGNKLNSVDIVVNKTLPSGDIVGLGNFAFSFNLTKSAVFTVQMGQGPDVTSNCKSTAQLGAGVALEEIRVSDAAATQCLQFDLVVENTTMDTCAAIVCEERGVTHAVTGLPAGNYLIQALGYKGATGPNPYVCYQSTAKAFSIGSTDLNLGNIVAPFLISGADPRCNATKPEPQGPQGGEEI